MSDANNSLSHLRYRYIQVKKATATTLNNNFCLHDDAVLGTMAGKTNCVQKIADKTTYSQLLKVNYFLIRLLQSPLTTLIIFYSAAWSCRFPYTRLTGFGFIALPLPFHLLFHSLFFSPLTLVSLLIFRKWNVWRCPLSFHKYLEMQLVILLWYFASNCFLAFGVRLWRFTYTVTLCHNMEDKINYKWEEYIFGQPYIAFTYVYVYKHRSANSLWYTSRPI